MSSFSPLPLPSTSEEGYFSLSPFLSFCFECPFESLTKLGWVEFFLLAALLYSAHCAKRGKGVFRLLDQWEQSLVRRMKAFTPATLRKAPHKELSSSGVGQ
jgi:hypothetical protein